MPNARVAPAAAARMPALYIDAAPDDPPALVAVLAPLLAEELAPAGVS